MDTIRVFRLIEYYGPRDKVEEEIAKSIHGERIFFNEVRVRATTVGPTHDIVTTDELFTPKKGDPIYFEKGLWYFWDETWSNSIGPYDTQALARASLKKYCDELDKGVR